MFVSVSRLSVSVLRELTFTSVRMGLYEPIRNFLVSEKDKGKLANLDVLPTYLHDIKKTELLSGDRIHFVLFCC